jgi:electron transport complex protein RnfA
VSKRAGLLTVPIVGLLTPILERANPPQAFRGTAIALVTAGLLGLAFMGFSGLVKM